MKSRKRQRIPDFANALTARVVRLMAMGATMRHNHLSRAPRIAAARLAACLNGRGGADCRFQLLNGQYEVLT